MSVSFTSSEQEDRADFSNMHMGRPPAVRTYLAGRERGAIHQHTARSQNKRQQATAPLGTCLQLPCDSIPLILHVRFGRTSPGHTRGHTTEDDFVFLNLAVSLTPNYLSRSP